MFSFRCSPIILCASIIFARLHQQDGVSTPGHIHHRRIIHPQPCGFTGNSDIYGLGIRLGVYLQWVAALISKQYLVSSRAGIMRELLDVNTIFSLAIFIATVVLSTDHGGSAHGVEILIMLHIYFGSTYIISYEQLLRGRHGQGLTFFGVLATICITTGMSAYAIYYWFHGLDLLPRTECGSFAFLFAKVRLEGPVKTFFKFAAVINMIVWGSGFLLLWCYAIPVLISGLFKVGFYNAKYGLHMLFKHVFGTKGDVEAPWRQTSRGHLRHVVGLYMGYLGAPRSEREVKPGWPANLGEDKVWLESRSKQDNPIV
ncbi:MAG: hypothetical protein Q9217_005206 [Psora testacea]